MKKQTMRRQTLKVLLTGICMLAAGICYSCGRDVPGPAKGEPYMETAQAEETDPEGIKTEGAEAGISDAGTSGFGESSPEAATQDTKAPYYVHVCGEVKSPGVYEMEAGSRVFQAVEMAGGLTEEAAGEYLNMAEPIQDGMKVLVPSVEEVAAGGAAALTGGTAQGISGGAGQSARVNINTADKEQLMTLKGIGEARAEDIIRYRTEHGPFGSIEEIMEVSGIKDAAFQKIKEDITV